MNVRESRNARCSVVNRPAVRPRKKVLQTKRASSIGPGRDGVHSGTALAVAGWYIPFMEFTFARVALGVAWIGLVCVVGLLTGAASVFHWVVLASIAVIPPVLARTLSRTSALRPSPHRQEARR